MSRLPDQNTFQQAEALDGSFPKDANICASARKQDVLMRGVPDHPEVKQDKIGVLLVNLGTPDNLTVYNVRTYLSEFLSDRRVIDYPGLLWQPLLQGVILNTRPRKTRDAYKEIWDRETDESPLRRYTREQSEKLNVPTHKPDNVIYDWAMRYGSPSIADRLDALTEQGCRKILIAPLYPQYSATTTATVCDKAFDWAQKQRWMPALRTMPAFYDDPFYIDVLAESYRSQIKENTERVIISFHGLPKRYFKAGDPYYCHCAKTARLIRERMNWTEAYAPLAFQSKFGPEEWLGPSTESEVVRAAESGCENIAVIAPGFVSDCIETLEEIGIGLAETFQEHGGKSLTAVPCLNSSEGFIEVLQSLVSRELRGWI